MTNAYKLSVDLELLKKYNRQGPRYTSYPTAPQFSENFDSSDFRREIVDSNRGANLPDLSLYFHIPFCRSLCYFCACNRIITHSQERVEKYIGGLKKEIDLVSSLVNERRRVVQLHWGGGTPTYLAPEQIRDLFLYIRDRFNIANDAEIAMEIDPRGLSSAHLPTIREVGFNRLSFGVQDFEPKVQKAVNRIQPESLSREVVKTSRELGFESVNIDLIYGLPYQTLESYARTLDKIVDISPDRLAVFNWAYVPWLNKHQCVIPRDAVPTAGDRLRLLKMIIERLTESGYVYIGMDHFAKPEDELTLALENRSLHRNFQGYSTRAGAEVYGIGVTSISQLRNAYAQNTKDPRIYGDELRRGRFPTYVGYRLNDDDKLRRHVITELMCNGRVVKSEVGSRYGIDFDSYFADSISRLDEFIGDGLLKVSGDGLEVLGAGRLAIRNIVMAFDRYLDQSGDGARQTYSRTI